MSGIAGTINAAAEQGNLEMVKYCVAKKCPIGYGGCERAAENGHLECLKYLREEVKSLWSSGTAFFAARNGHLHILEYLVERKYDKYDAWACAKCSHARPLGLFEVLARNRQMRRGTRTPYILRTRTTTPNVHNTSSTITVLSHLVGDTKTENYAYQKRIEFIK